MLCGKMMKSVGEKKNYIVNNNENIKKRELQIFKRIEDQRCVKGN